MRALWTETDDALLRKWHAKGLCDREIGEKIGRSKSHVSSMRRLAGLPPHHGRGGLQPGAFGRKGCPSFSRDAYLPSIKRLAAAGHTGVEIARRLGVTRNVVCGLCDRNGIKIGKPRVGKHHTRPNGKSTIVYQRDPYRGEGPTGCRYPHGEGANLTWCDAKRVPGKPYCEAHCAVCYRRGEAA